MSVFMDGCDHYATADILTKWSDTSGGTITANGRNGGNAMTLSIQLGYVTKVLDAQSTWRVGAAWKTPTPGNQTQGVFQLWDGLSGICHLELSTDATGHLQVTRGKDGTLLGTGTTVLLANTWYYIELYAVINDTTGAVTVRVNEIDEITLTSVDTRNGGNATADTLYLGQAMNFTSIYWDDIYALTGSDASAFWGDVRIESLFPTAEGASSSWTPSTGTDNSALVDEAAPNGDTDYVRSLTAAQKDTYVYGNLTPTTGLVRGVQWLADIRKDDAGARSVCPVYRPVSTDFDGTTQSVLDSYTYLREVKTLNPATAAAWTIAEVNAAEFGIKLVS